MGDVGDDMRAWRDHKKAKKEAYAKNAYAMVKRVELRGHDIEWFSNDHCRVDGWIDWWPTTGTWMPKGTKRKYKGSEGLLKALKERIVNQ